MKDETRLKLYDLWILQLRDSRKLKDALELIFVRFKHHFGDELEIKKLSVIFEILNYQYGTLEKVESDVGKTLSCLRHRAGVMRNIISAEVFPPDNN